MECSGYSNYKKLRQVVDKFDLKVRQVNLLEGVQPFPPSDWLTTTLSIAYSIPMSNEKVKSERVISPILSEVHQLYKNKLTLFSGEELNVLPDDNLNGACDFFFSSVPNAYLLEAPIVSMTEAKDEDMDYGIAQCAAQMIGAQIFNQQSGQPVDVIWGCATTAIEWKFLKLTGKTLYIDEASFTTERIDKLIGAFRWIFKDL